MADPKKLKPSLRNLATGDVLFREGEVGDFAYQVVKGKIEVTKFNGDEYVTLAILEKGALFGEMALISNSPRNATLVATDDSKLFELKKSDLEELFDEHEVLFRELEETIKNRSA